MMPRTITKDITKKENQNIKLAGWVGSRRDHGKIIFIDLRDRWGLVQIVFTPKNKKVYEIASNLRPEWVIELEGKVKKRPSGMENKDLLNGLLEIEAESIKVLSESKPLPFPKEGDGYSINEELRLRYRYLDLRRDRLKNNLILKAEVYNEIRNFLKNWDFIEVETPILTKSTPEGARDFLVPSRLHKGKFYALPQSPQQYKQLLMVAGLERYFQFARNFRDEDVRADRAFEFTQFDLEMSFVSQEDIMSLIEELVIHISENALGKKIQEKPFPRLTYDLAMNKYKRDNPDLRKNKESGLLSYTWIVDFPMFEKRDDGSLGTAHHPFTKIKEEFLPQLRKGANLGKIKAYQYDLVLNGAEVFGGSIRETNPEILSRVFEVLGHSRKEIDEKFGHLLEAFSFGVPPHGGIAASDRWLQVMLGEPTIREVSAFPMTGSGNTAVMEAPTEIDKSQLKELGIKLDKNK